MINRNSEDRPEGNVDSAMASVEYIRENLADLLLDSGNVELVLDTIDESDVLAGTLTDAAAIRRAPKWRMPAAALAGAAAVLSVAALTLGQPASQLATGSTDTIADRAGVTVTSPLHVDLDQHTPAIPSTPLHPQDPAPKSACVSSVLHPCEVASQ